MTDLVSPDAIMIQVVNTKTDSDAILTFYIYLTSSMTYDGLGIQGVQSESNTFK
jgi:hypothetical protein